MTHSDSPASRESAHSVKWSHGDGAGCERAILHLDMDAFFVNVYLLDHPEDRGRPVVVGGSPDGRGVVAAASYEARSYGVHSAMPSSRAARLCPDLKFVRHDWSRIKACSRQVMDILGQFGPLEPMSVDEAYVDLTGEIDPIARAREVRDRTKAETGLPASVGLATSKLVAKVASDHDKPEGFTVVLPGEEGLFLAPLSVRSLHGIGPATAARLKAAGIEYCRELQAADPVVLAGAVGKMAEALIARAGGSDPRPVVAGRGPPKSVSSETTFDRDIRDARELELTLADLARSVGASLRRRGLVAQTISVKFRLADFTTFTRQQALASATDQDVELFRHGRAIFRRHWPRRPLRLLGFGASRLSDPDERQLGLTL